MQFAVGKVLKNLRGVPLNTKETVPDQEAPGGYVEAVVPLTYGLAAINALLGEYKDDHPNSSEKARRYATSAKISNALEADGPDATVELSAREVEVIKLLSGKAYNALVSGQIWSEVDPEWEKNLQKGKDKDKEKNDDDA